MRLDAIVVLGCRVGPAGTLAPAAERRVRRAASAYREEGADWLIASGGKCWHGVSEALAFKARLIELGVPEAQILTELYSKNTRQNARYTSQLARERSLSTVGIVTCDWHIPRALRAFEHYGLSAQPIPARSPSSGWQLRRHREPLHQLWDGLWIALERTCRWLGAILLVLLGCRAESAGSAAPSASAASPKVEATPRTELERALLAAEQTRRTSAIPAEALTSNEEVVRALAARAWARSVVGGGVDPLLPLLSDESPRVLAYAAFGLGRACAGHQAEVVRALTLRVASLVASGARPPGTTEALTAAAQALGACGGPEAERSLAAWLSLDPELARGSSLALAEIGAQRGGLQETTEVALLDAASRRQAPIDEALFALGRALPSPGPVRDRVVEIAISALGSADIRRSFAIRVLGRAQALEPLANVLAAPGVSPGQRAEIARELSAMGSQGQAALARGLTALLAKPGSSGGEVIEQIDNEQLISALVILDVLTRAPRFARDTLAALAKLELPTQPVRRRHAVLLRCSAARLLAMGALDRRELLECDPDPAGRAGKLAMLFVLGQGKLLGARAQRFQALASDDDSAVQIAALRLIPAHREFTSAATLLEHALGSRALGVVATAAEVIAAHPERVSAAEPGRHGNDSENPSPQLVQALTLALRAATALPNVGVRAVLIDAVAALRVLGLVSELSKECEGDNPTLREHAERALRGLGQPSRKCAAPPDTARVPPELEHLLTQAVRLVFVTDAGDLTLDLDPERAPVAVTRITDLVRSGFYDGMAIHRVLPSFVVQFGDPEDDGYGGAKLPPLRSEISPVPFEPGAVGIAESGADSGSSQVFVALSRLPQLDGRSTRIGQAGVGWDRVIVGDRILRARVELRSASSAR